MTLPTPALSIRQPWAHAVFRLGKDIENRNWHTDRRGRVWIHASKTMGKLEREIYNDMVAQCHPMPPFEALPRGCIIGHVEIVDCVEQHPSQWKMDGTWGFVLRDPVLLRTPVPCPGQLQFFNLHPAIHAKLAEQVTL